MDRGRKAPFLIFDRVGPMKMFVDRFRNNHGVTIVEIMVAIVIILVAVIGATGFRYHSALDARKADVKITAGRIGSLLLEGWVGTGGQLTYDPVAEYGTDMNISTCATGPAVPTGFTKLDNYQVVANRANYYATLSYKDSTPTQAGELNIFVAWLHSGQAGTVSSSDQSVKLTGYVNN
jgi:Tfp pilus assembly protein PilV